MISRTQAQLKEARVAVSQPPRNGTDANFCRSKRVHAAGRPVYRLRRLRVAQSIPTPEVSSRASSWPALDVAPVPLLWRRVGAESRRPLVVGAPPTGQLAAQTHTPTCTPVPVAASLVWAHPIAPLKGQPLSAAQLADVGGRRRCFRARSADPIPFVRVSAQQVGAPRGRTLAALCERSSRRGNRPRLLRPANSLDHRLPAANLRDEDPYLQAQCCSSSSSRTLFNLVANKTKPRPTERAPLSGGWPHL